MMLPETIKSCRVLIVDDDAGILEALRRVLVAQGHTVRVTTDPREALVLYEKDRFDLVVLDYDMPDIKGDELALIIKSLVPSQALVMITADPGPLAPNLLTEVDVVVPKPFSSDDFCNAVNRFWSRVDPAVIQKIETEHFRRTSPPPVELKAILVQEQHGD